MITDFILQQAGRLWVWILSAFPVGTYPDSFYSAMDTIGGVLNSLDVFLPISTLFVCLLVIVGAWGVVFSTKIVFRAVRLIKR